MMNAVSICWLLVVVLKNIYLINANWITGNLCWSMPCMNGGSCFGSAYTYLCICPTYYTGVLCEKRLGVCQENPCGNRGLCIDKSLTSFECRCYFDYMGPTCKEHVTKNDPDIWSSLSPVHTRVLFDMLQEAYRAKSRRKSLIASKNGQVDFIGLLSTRTTSMPITSTTVETTTTFTTDQNETTKIEHIIPAHAIQLDQIFSDISTASTLDMNTYEFTEPFFQYDNPTTSVNDIISTTMIIENIPTTVIEQIQTDFSNTINDQNLVNITEESNIMITSTPIHFSNDNNLIDDMTTQNLIEETNHSTKSVIINTMNPIDLTSSNLDIKIDEDNDDKSYSLDQTITNTSEQPLSIDTTTMSQTLHSQLLYKLCQQFFSHILPNASLSSAAATALSLSSNSPSTNNHTTDVFLSWLSKYLRSSTSTTTSSTVSPLIINEIQTLSIPLQRIDMDDVLHQMSNNIDNEH